MDKRLTLVANKTVSALKSLISPGIDLTSTIVTTDDWRSFNNTSISSNRNWFFDGGGQGVDVYFNYGGLTDIMLAYECCPQVHAIINKQALNFINGRTRVIDTRNKNQEVDNSQVQELLQLLRQPNFIQNQAQFEAQLEIYVRLFGFCVILPIVPSGFKLKDATSFWIIPAFMCQFEYNNASLSNLRTNTLVKRIIITAGNETSYLNPDQVIIIRDFTPNFNDIFLPGSPIKPISQNINNLLGIYNSKGMLINYRGAMGVISPEIDPNGAIAMTDPEKEALQAQFMKYGLRKGQMKYIISNSAIKWQQIGVPYRDLMFTEWAEDDTMVICDVLNYPFKLLSNTKSVTLNGSEVREFKKQHIEEFTIPQSDLIMDQFSVALGLTEMGWKLSKDFSHMPVMQEDDLKKAQARYQRNQACQIEFFNNQISLNRWNELNSEQPVTDGDLFYKDLVAKGWVFGKAGVSIQDLMGTAPGSNSNNETKPKN